MSRNIRILSLKILIVVLAYFFLIKKVANSSDIFMIGSELKVSLFSNTFILFITVLLMLLNWSVETIKWISFLPKKMRISFKKGIKAVFAGITFGSITPNRIGEFGGRIMFIKKKSRKKAAVYTLIADSSQMIITIVFGLVAFSLTGFQILSEYTDNILLLYFLLFFGIALSFLGLYLYFNLSIIKNIIIKINYFKKHEAVLNEFSEIKSNLLLRLLFYSSLRYIIFTMQFYLISRFFNLDISLINCILASSNVFFISTLLPNIPFSEIGIRSSLAIVFFGVYTDAYSLILLTSLVVYFINIVIPGVLGGLFLLNTTKINRQNLSKRLVAIRPS